MHCWFGPVLLGLVSINIASWEFNAFNYFPLFPFSLHHQSPSASSGNKKMSYTRLSPDIELGEYNYDIRNSKSSSPASTISQALTLNRTNSNQHQHEDRKQWHYNFDIRSCSETSGYLLMCIVKGLGLILAAAMILGVILFVAWECETIIEGMIATSRQS